MSEARREQEWALKTVQGIDGKGSVGVCVQATCVCHSFVSLFDCLGEKSISLQSLGKLFVDMIC